MATQSGRRHPVTLLAPSGREQPVILVVAREGVRLTTVDGKIINTFAYETIRKWLPSHLRSKNPGPDDCLDVQIETDKGPRDLRMRCANVTAVKHLMKDLRDTVESIMRDMNDDEWVAANSPSPPRPVDEAARQQELGTQGQQAQAIRELPSIAATVPAATPQGGQGSTPAISQRSEPAMRRNNAETQTPDEVAQSAQQQRHQQQQPQTSSSGGPPQHYGAAPSQPRILPSRGGGVAQLFLAHPTGVAVPVNSRGIPTPALLEGLQQATLPITPLVPSSGTFAHEFMDQYGTGGGSSIPDELDVVERSSSAATGFVNAMFQQPRGPIPVYGVYSQPSPSMPPHSPPLSPGIPSAGASSGGYYPQSLEVHTQPPQPAPMSVPTPQMYYSAPAVQPGHGHAALRQQQYYQPQPPQQHQPPPPQQQHTLPPHYPPLPRAGSQRSMRTPAGYPVGRPPRRSDPTSTSPVRRRVEFSGVAPGHMSDSELSDSVGVSHYAHYAGGRPGAEAGGTSSTVDSDRGSGSSDDPRDARSGDTGDGMDLQHQVRFLEDLVSRLSAEVSRRGVSPERATAAAMALSGAVDTTTATSPATAATPVIVQAGSAVIPPPPIDYEGLLSADALGAAAVLRDQKLLAPLLAAYDSRIAQLEADLRSRTEQVQALKGQVDDVVEENDHLHADLNAASDARDAALAQANSATAAAAAANAAVTAAAVGTGNNEELELLRRENELLLTQQSEMDAEIQRLHRQLQERAQEALRGGQEQSVLMSQLQQANAKEADGRAAKLAEGLRATEAKAAALATQVSRSKAALDEANAATATTKMALEELRHAHTQLQAEAVAAQQRYKVASDGAASLQLELSTARERADALQVQVSTLNRECETLRAALGGVEGKLTELQRRDADVWTRVKEAMTAAEEARLARDAAQARCMDLERQVELANTRLLTVRQATRDAVADEFNAQINAAESAAAQVREELVAAQAAVSEWRARAERLERDQASLTAEMASLREDTAAALASKSRLGLASLGAVEKVAAVERERDEAVAKLESAQRKAERVARDAQMERQSMEHTLRGLKSTVAELETSLAAARAEVANGKRQLEAAGRELTAARAARQQTETELRQQMAALRTDREADMRAFTSKLEAQATAANAAAAEAERLLSNKQEVLARWREEAQTLASRMEAALAEHKRELAAKGHEAAELRSRVEALSAENVELAAVVSELEAKIDDLHAQLADADARADAAAAQLMSASAREAELQHELRQIQMMLDRTQFEKNRMQRAHDPLTAKYDALKKDIRQTISVSVPTATTTTVATSADGLPLHPSHIAARGISTAGTTGWAGSPDAVVHASRGPRGSSNHLNHTHPLGPGR
ncbi:hypothetical protein Vretifemale_12064 [Volvox reticuliferus]|uniref:Uncharacterized protein n=1 Tax=Volvox reticuliferus TaxID=1737510 RepID=A0A8J4CJP3_9CHLO|nr:hypothetical protein Vretifemale_12064 [Volvox reticuliferus]